MSNNNKTICRNFARGLTKRKMRWQKAPLESGDFDENGEMAETFMAFLQGVPLAN